MDKAKTKITVLQDELDAILDSFGVEKDGAIPWSLFNENVEVRSLVLCIDVARLKLIEEDELEWDSVDDLPF